MRVYGQQVVGRIFTVEFITFLGKLARASPLDNNHLKELVGEYGAANHREA